MQSKSAWLGVLVALFSVGCGQQGGDATVEGKVTLDGFPLESGSVVFIAANTDDLAPASGSIDQQGNYKLVIGRSTDLESGEYLAQVKSVGEAIKQPDGAPPLPGKLLTPAKYARAETSGLRYRLRPGKNVIDIALASDPEPEGEADGDGASEAAEGEAEPAEEEAAADEPAEEPAVEEAAAEEAPAEEPAEAEEQPAE